MSYENTKNLIKSFTKEDYQSKVNLHVHSTFSDGEGDFDELLDQAKQSGYKKIAISDHNTIEGHLRYQDEILLPAVEFDCWCGYVFFHLLAYGIDPKDNELDKFYAKNKNETTVDIVRLFTRRNIKELITAIHNSGGIAVLAHPACCWAINLESFIKKLVSFGLDGVEVYYPYVHLRRIVKFHSSKKVNIIADKLGLLKTGGTDCHAKKLQ